MLAAALQLGRAALEVPSALRGAAQLASLRGWRAFSSSEPPNDAPESPHKATPAGGSGRGSRPFTRLQTTEWRSWIDTKLDSTLGGASSADKPAAAAAAAADSSPEDIEERARRAVAIADALQAAESLPDEPAAAGAAKRQRRGPAPSTQPRAKGFELQQQIYNIVSPSYKVVEHATLPDGVSNYGQLAMAADAPRFARSARNIADVSPLRVHPTRLFFPEQIYSPAELDPYKAAETAHDFDHTPPPAITKAEVKALADYKNAPLLAAFLSGAGKLPLRTKTHLPAKLHRHLARQVKSARILAILPTTEQWKPPQEPDRIPRPRRGNQQRQQRESRG